MQKKKADKEKAKRRRRVWGFNPKTRAKPLRPGYNRQQEKRPEDELPEE